MATIYQYTHICLKLRSSECYYYNSVPIQPIGNEGLLLVPNNICWSADVSLVWVILGLTSISPTNAHIWKLHKICYKKLIPLYWLNWCELEADQHHIIMPHHFYDLSNLVLKKYKLVNYNKFTSSSKWIVVACCIVYDRYVSSCFETVNALPTELPNLP